MDEHSTENIKWIVGICRLYDCLIKIFIVIQTEKVNLHFTQLCSADILNAVSKFTTAYANSQDWIRCSKLIKIGYF